MKDNAQSVASGCLPLSGGTMTGDIINGAIAEANNTVSVAADYGTAGIRINTSQYQVNATHISLYPDPGGCRIGSGIGNRGSSDKYMRICNVADPIGPADVANKDYVDSKAGGIPSGVIAMWSGAANAIPTGWLLCNGSNGTPDLRNRFIVGAGALYSVGATGGSDTVTLGWTEMPTHSHTLTERVKASTHIGQGSYWGTMDDPNNASYETKYTASAGNGQPHENRPPYYALCYIMKQ